MTGILHRLGIRAPREAVYAALATTGGIAGWWTTDTTGDAGEGGTLVTRFHADGRLLGSFDLAVREARPGSQVVWEVLAGPPEWVGTRIRFGLRTEEDWTIVLFHHDGWRDTGEFFGHCSLKWAVFLMSLKSLLETGTGRPAPDDVRIGDWH
jgi:hypothetical protein